MRFGKRRSSGRTLHPVTARIGLMAIFESSPVALVIMDERGDVVDRNQAAAALLRDLTAAHGDQMVLAFRQAFRDIAGSTRVFPHQQLVRIGEGSRYAELDIGMNAVPGGFLFTWREVTAQRDQAHLLSQTADELAALARSFEQLGAILNRDTGKVSERTEAVADGARQLSASIGEIASSATSAAANTSAAVQEAALANEQITRLAESSTQIGTVSKLINSIAKQTNLLALNATIEAARAGEAGRGFAVVAGEVKDLAARTGAATDQIAAMIEAIQSDSERVAASIQQIVSAIGQIEAEQTTIASAVEEQSATAGGMSSSIEAAATAAQSSVSAAHQVAETAGEISLRSEQIRQAL